MSLGAILGAGSSLLGGLFGSNSAKKAAETQANIAANQLAIEQKIYKDTTKRFEPFVDAGTNALAALNFELGLGERPTFGGTAPEVVSFNDTPVVQQQPFQPNTGAREFGTFDPRLAAGGAAGPVQRFRVNDQVFNTRKAAQAYADDNRTGGSEYQGYQLSPDYQYLQDQAILGVDSSAASRGTLNSGATLKAAQDRASDIASLGRNNYLNRLTGQAGAGQAAAGNQATAGSNFAAGAGNALAGYGNAVSAGQIGSFNALSQGVNNAIGVFNYQNNLANQGQQNNGGIFGGLFG